MTEIADGNVLKIRTNRNFGANKQERCFLNTKGARKKVFLADPSAMACLDPTPLDVSGHSDFYFT